MRRILITALGLAALGVVLAGCGDEDPTSVGSDLLGPGVRTYEVFLEGREFLEADTAFDRLGTLNRAGFWLVAEDFEEEVDAAALFSVNRPFAVTYQDSAGTTRSDSVAAIVGGTLTLIVDTLASTPGPVELELHALEEDWDWLTATWELRYDTADVAEPWTTPGGTLGARMGSGVWLEGDTLQIPLDSQTVAVWQDTLAAVKGGLVRSVTPGSRLVLRGVQFQFDVLPQEAQDTVVQAGGVLSRVSIVTPDPPPASAEELRVGGLPGWRSFLRFQPLAERRISCGPAAPAGCTVALNDVTINLATLVLEPLPVAGRRIERPIWLENRGVLPGPEGVPLTRSPLSGLLGFTRDSVPVEVFEGTAGDLDPVQVPVTNFMRRLVSPPTDEEPWLWMALTVNNEFSMFGYASFGSLTSPWAPRLRLVVSVPDEELGP